MDALSEAQTMSTLLSVNATWQTTGRPNRLSRPVRAGQDLTDCRGKVIQARARDDDGIAASVGLFRDPQELSAVIFPELHVKIFPLNLKLLGLDDVVHLSGVEFTPLG
jgi:hypothetical protein